DRSWLETPFLRHRMRVTKAEQIEKLKSCGVRYVEVEAGDAPQEAPPPLESLDPQTLASPADSAEPAPGIPYHEELRVARQVYRAAKLAVEQAMQDVRMGKEINTDVCGSVVENLADSVLRNPNALTSLSRLKSFDQYTFFHSVNTSILAMTLGYRLGFD